MVVKRGNKVLRSFKVVAVQNVSGCVTKFKAGRYTDTVPMSAAKKAFSRLCNLKKIKNKCTFIITIQDTTNESNSKGKEYTYKVDRLKLKNPIIRFEGEENEYKISYGVTAKKSSQIEKCKTGRERSRGRMRKYSLRQRKMASKKKTKTSDKKNVNNNNKNNNNNYYNKNKSQVVRVKKGKKSKKNKSKKNNMMNNNRKGL